MSGAIASVRNNLEEVATGAGRIARLVAVSSMAALVVVGLGTAAAKADDMNIHDTMQLAAGSCTGTYSVCVARCRKDNPTDKACPSDHCAPKLSECRSTGCWQEGQRYGGRKTCNLKLG